MAEKPYILQAYRIICLSGGSVERDNLASAVFFELAESLEQLRWLENGYTIKAGITEVETIGIDTPQDLEHAERFLQARNAQ